MRIIAGKYKGHQLVSFRADHIRPTTDRVKESLFNQIQEELEGARVLDLFGGTGNLSLECLSRGARSTLTVELNKTSLEIIQKNKAKLKVGPEMRILGLDVMKFLKKNSEDAFDLILIDPPFTEKMAHAVMTALSHTTLYNEKTLIFIESSKQERIDEEYGELIRLDQRHYGDKFLSLFRKKSAQSTSAKGALVVSKLVSQLKPSPTLALAAKGKDLQRKGHDVIALTVGEPDWETTDIVKARGVEVIQSGQTKYTPANGIVELRQAVAEQFNKWFKTKLNENHVTATSGAKFILFSALQTLLNPGDECIIPTPFWVSYPSMVDLCHARSVFIETDARTQFKITGEKLQAAITDKTKVFLFNSPSNPTGISYTRDELSDLARVLREHPHVAILSDDIYNQLSFDGSVRSPHLLDVAPELADRLISVNGGSKAYAMTGWRIGWAVGPKEVISGMSNYQSQALGCASSIAQEAAVVAILKTDDEVANVRMTLKDRSERALKSLEKVQGLKVFNPDSAFYIWADISQFLGKSFEGRVLKDSRDFCEALLMSQYVVVVPGQEFGADGYIRMSFALLPEDFERATQRMAAFCASL